MPVSQLPPLNLVFSVVWGEKTKNEIWRVKPTGKTNPFFL